MSNPRPLPLARLVFGALLLCTAPGSSIGADDRASFQATRLADGVLLLSPADGRDDLRNSLLVERDDGLLVVDAQPTPSAARELLAAIAESHEKPVRYLVVSHPHAEAAGGASAFPESTLMIAHFAYRETLASDGHEFLAELGAGRDDAPADGPPRRRPVLLVFGASVLDDPRNPVELRTMQPAHSPADMIVSLQAHDILYVGSLVSLDRNPYAGDADIGGWVAVLNSISREAPTHIVPLRGPAADVRAVRAQRDGLAWVRGQVEGGFIDQIPPDEIPGRVLATPGIEKRFDLEATPSFVPMLIERVLDEAIGQRRKRGLM